MISAKILLDSVGAHGIRITTFELAYPRFIHSQLMTHRVFSRSVASSRAVPVRKMIETVENDKTELFWGKNQSGMQADSELDDIKRQLAKEVWESAKLNAIESARKLANIGLHKQLANRLLEPFSIAHTILTGTEFDNFYRLRLTEHAQPEMQSLAKEMFDAQNNSTPILLKNGKWHLPFIDKNEESLIQNSDIALIYVSAARCARISYTPFGEVVRDTNKDYLLAQKLIADRHLSPFEHQAMCIGSPLQLANFSGWLQARHYIEFPNS